MAQRSDHLDWQDLLIGLLGLYLFFSPWLVGYSGEHSSINAFIVCAIIAVLAVSAFFEFHTWEETTIGAFGVWLIVAPWALTFNEDRLATKTQVAIGLIALALAIWSAISHRGQRAHFGNGGS